MVMRRRLPPLKALPAFEAAARHLSFTAAADELGLTHGAISHQMKALEAHLGVALFRRLNRRIELTEVGNAFLRAVRTALDVVETSANQIAAPAQRGPLVLSCLPTFMMRWLLPRLYEFSAKHPDIEVRLSASYAPVDFAQDSVDAAIRVGTPTWPGGIEAHAFLEERVGPVCSPDLLKRRPLARPADLRQHTLLHTDSRLDAWPHWIEVVGVKGIASGKGPRFEHYYFLLEAAVGGLGVALAPYPLVAEDLRRGRLVAPLDFVSSDRAYYFLSLRERANVAKIRTFRSWLTSATAEPRPPLTIAATARGERTE
jgi:LysR family glycine cleavage system transcriptional activator